MANENREEEAEKQSFDFDYITQNLGLLPLPGGGSAINPQMVSSLDRDEENDVWRLTLESGEEFLLSDEDLAELEELIKSKQEIMQSIQKETIKRNLRAQAEAAAELNASVQPGMIIGAGKRFKN